MENKKIDDIMESLKSIKTEDDVEKKIILPLLIELGYDSKKISWKPNKTINLGRKKHKIIADGIYEDLLAIEAKSPNESVSSGIEQADSYAFGWSTKFSLICNGREILVRGYKDNKKITIISIKLLDLKNEYNNLENIISLNNISNFSIGDLEPTSLEEIKNYNIFFNKIHNVIRNNEKLDPIKSFDEFSKVLFFKFVEVLENKDHSSVMNNPDITDSDKMQIINSFFENGVKKYFDSNFELSERTINISLKTFIAIYDNLKRMNLSSDFDIKGKAFETFLPSQLRGKGLGQYFTPRNIVKFIIKLVKPNISDTILDPACGSGGFLISFWNSIFTDIQQLPNSYFEHLGIMKDKYVELLKSRSIFGFDAEPRAVRIARINMMLWGDGENIIRANSLSDKNWIGKKYKDSIRPSLILTNPPFIKEKDPYVLNLYELSKDKKEMDAHSLFIEMCINQLEPGGRMAIVLPEGIFSNPTAKNVRDLIFKNGYIRNIISLPNHTFVQSGVDTINTVILYFEKFNLEILNDISSFKTQDEIVSYITLNLNYKIIFSKINNLGYKPNGMEYSGHNDLDELIQQINNNDIIEVNEERTIDSIKNLNFNESSCESVVVLFSKLKSRLDPKYYIFIKKYENLMINWPTIGSYGIGEYTEKISISDDQLNDVFKLASVDKNNTNGFILYKEDKYGSELIKETQLKKILPEGTICYNPFRANIGSISYVNQSGLCVSGAYDVFKVENIDNHFLTLLLKTPFYNHYIDVVTTGSIRNNLSLELLSDIKIPIFSEEEIIDLKDNFNSWYNKKNEYEVNIQTEYDSLLIKVFK